MLQLRRLVFKCDTAIGTLILFIDLLVLLLQLFVDLLAVSHVLLVRRVLVKSNLAYSAIVV